MPPSCNGDACPSWVGRKMERGGPQKKRGSPAVVVQRQVGDDLAPFQVEAARSDSPRSRNA